eukprot:2129211-Pleurochrysis_carterae.AAC.2
MLNRGRAESSLAGLRKRLANLFLQVEAPDCHRQRSVAPAATVATHGSARCSANIHACEAFDAK